MGERLALSFFGACAGLAIGAAIGIIMGMCLIMLWHAAIYGYDAVDWFVRFGGLVGLIVGTFAGFNSVIGGQE